MFAVVRGRYIVLTSLMLMFHLPGADWLAQRFLASAPWYWWMTAYVLYGQLLFVLAVLLTISVPVRVPTAKIFGNEANPKDVRSGLVFCIFLMLVAWTTLYLVYWPLSFWIPNFVNYWLIDIPSLIYFDFETEVFPFLPNVLTLMSICVLAPVFEELAFRGVLLHRWAHKYGLRSAVIRSSLLFGILHPDFLGAFLFGVGMCALYLRTQSLWLPIICHSAYNLTVWLIEVVLVVIDGPDYVLTLEDFQSDWPVALVSGLLALAWVAWYLRRPTQKTVWKLP